MTFDLVMIQESKRKMRRYLAALPVAEKLALLDAMRERAQDLSSARPKPSPGAALRPDEPMVKDR